MIEKPMCSTLVAIANANSYIVARGSAGGRPDHEVRFSPGHPEFTWTQIQAALETGATWFEINGGKCSGRAETLVVGTPYCYRCAFWQLTQVQPAALAPAIVKR